MSNNKPQIITSFVREYDILSQEILNGSNLFTFTITGSSVSFQFTAHEKKVINPFLFHFKNELRVDRNGMESITIDYHNKTTGDTVTLSFFPPLGIPVVPLMLGAALGVFSLSWKF